MRLVATLLLFVATTSFADPLTDVPPLPLPSHRVPVDGVAIGGAVLLAIGASMAIGAIIATTVPSHDPIPAGCDVCGGPDNLGTIAAVGVVGTLATAIATPLFIVGMKHHADRKRALYVESVSPMGISGRF